MLRFGGHAMAAGLTLHAARLDEFTAQFEQAVEAFADPDCFAASLVTDGSLASEQIDLTLVDTLEREVWGQGFAPPLFHDEFVVARQSVVAGRHLKAQLRLAGGRALDAIAFGRVDPLPARARLAYRLARDEYRGLASVSVVIQEVDAP
jgi:single-stranded-DNA-specific exonuclease